MSKSDIEQLDDVFSKFIRLSNADQWGMVRCISCGKRMNWKQADNGHFVPRGNMSLRFDPKNCHPQCQECNRGKYGNIKDYREALVKRFGIVHVEYLESKKNEERDFAHFEIELLILHYTKEVKRLLQEKT